MIKNQKLLILLFSLSLVFTQTGFFLKKDTTIKETSGEVTSAPEKPKEASEEVTPAPEKPKETSVKTDETNPVKSAKKKSKGSSLVWNESLRLEDFYLMPEALNAKKDDLEKYKDIMKKEYKEHPDVFSVAISFGLLLIDLGETDKAEVVWNRALKDFHSNETPKVYKAWLDAKKGNYSQAKEVWYPIAREKFDNGIVGIDARIWLPYHIDSVLGLYLIKDNFPQEEKEDIEKVTLKIAGSFPSVPKFAAILASEALKEGHLEDAAKYLGAALSTNPFDGALVTLLGVSQLVAKDYNLALELFNKAVEYSPKGVTNHIMKARTLYAMGKKKESLEEFDKLLESNPYITFNNKKEKFLSTKSFLTTRKVQKAEDIK